MIAFKPFKSGNIRAGTFLLLGLALPLCGQTTPESEARAIRTVARFSGGVWVHVGCGEGALITALGKQETPVVQGLDTDPARVATARQRIAANGLYGRVSADHWDGTRLPYADNLINLVIADNPSPELREEINRVLTPLGALVTRKGSGWTRVEKPWPAEIDEWGHYLHDAGNNAVARDERVGPPRSLQWTGSPRWSRHHDRLASMSALVTAG